MSTDQYLAMEAQSQVRHEYVDGEIFLMSGASRRHNLIVGNLHGHAWQAKGAHGCEIFVANMRVRIEARNSIYYPDVMGSCDPEDLGDSCLVRPCFVIEVLSPSTASVDRREKRLAYMTLTSLQEYVIVDQDRMRVDIYRGGPWASQTLSKPEDVLHLACIDVRIPLEKVYAGVDMSTPCVRDDPGEVPDYAAG
jgi:Uma2 family endonuclease